MPTATIQVAAVTAPNAWTLGAGPNKVAAVNLPDDENTSFITTALLTNQQQYSVTNPIPPGSTINSVTAFQRTKRAATANKSQVRLHIGASTSTGVFKVLSAAYADYSDVLARPGGGSWSQADFSVLEIEIRINQSNSVSCTSLYIVVDYTPPPPTAAMLLVF